MSKRFANKFALVLAQMSHWTFCQEGISLTNSECTKLSPIKIYKLDLLHFDFSNEIMITENIVSELFATAFPG